VPCGTSQKAHGLAGDGAKQQFERDDPATHQTVTVQVLDLVAGGDPCDQYREVRLVLTDGRCYSAACWRDPQRRGGHRWEEPGMLIVPDLATADILAAVAKILGQAAIEDACSY
jgi:hypothetical protein